MSAAGQQKILIVDDDKHLLLALKDYFSFKGYQVAAVRSAEEALASLSILIPDLIVLDIGMPGIGGMGFLKEIQLRKTDRYIPILILTAKAMMEGFFSELDVDGFIAKPCSEEDLLRKVKEILSLRAATVQQEKPSHRKALLVEDDPVIAAEILNAFRVAPRRVEIVEAGSAAEAIEKMVTLKPDLVMTNEVLRGMNGGDMARLVRQMPGIHATPILLYRKRQIEGGMLAFDHRTFGGEDSYLTATDGLGLHDAVCHLLDSR